MNFKSILGVTVLALLGLSNAAPYNSGTKTVKERKINESILKTLPVKAPEFIDKTKSLPERVTGTKIVPSEYHIEKCKNKSGIPIILANELIFTSTCLIEYTEGDKNSKINPKNSACFYSKDTILCVDNELTNFDYCDKKSELFNYDVCLRTVHNLSVMSNVTDKVKLGRPMVTYPDKKRIVVTPHEDQKECESNNGIVFTYQIVYQYLCFYPEKQIENVKDTHCVSIDGKSYCIEKDLSSLNICKKNEDLYNSKECNNLLKIIGKNNNKKIEF